MEMCEVGRCFGRFLGGGMIGCSGRLLAFYGDLEEEEEEEEEETYASRAVSRYISPICCKSRFRRFCTSLSLIHI